MKLVLTNLQLDSLVHLIQAARVPNLIFKEAQNLLSIGLNGREWYDFLSQVGTVNPSQTNEIEVPEAEARAFLDLHKFSKENAPITFLYANALEHMAVRIETEFKKKDSEGVKPSNGAKDQRAGKQ